MPITKLPDPVDVKEMEKLKFSGNFTICQTLRDTYAITQQEDIRLRLRIIMAMAKSMDNKLREYKNIFKRLPALITDDTDGTYGGDQE